MNELTTSGVLDSTLRGHFPLKTDTIAACLAEHSGRTVDAVVIVPAFGEAGRITVGDVHYAGTAADGFMPVGDTEFAKDATFGYASSDLRDWVEEKTQGRRRAADVIALTLDVLRAGPAAVADVLRPLTGGHTVIVDCVEEDDLRILALGLDLDLDLDLAERASKHLLYRVGPPFVRARIGQEVRAALTADDVAGIGGGLVIVGSHLALTTRQLDALRERRAPTEVEIDVADVLDDVRRDKHLEAVICEAVEVLATGNVVIGTRRVLVAGGRRRVVPEHRAARVHRHRRRRPGSARRPAAAVRGGQGRDHLVRRRDPRALDPPRGRPRPDAAGDSLALGAVRRPRARNPLRRLRRERRW